MIDGFRAAPAISLLLSLGACAPLEGSDTVGQAGAEPVSSAAPTTASELIERCRDSLGRSVRAFDLVETEGDEIVRTGRVTVYPSTGRPVFDLVWDGAGELARARSDGETVFVRDRAGDLVFSAWSEAGSVLWSRAGGKLLGAALDPSAFVAYGAELAEGRSAARLEVEAPLPSGGGWRLAVSTESWLPESVSFRATSESAVERLELEPRAEPPALSAGELALAPGEGRTAEPFYAGPAPGDPAPEVTFELADGASVSLGDLRGSVVVLDFWATWCAPCRPAMKQLEALHRRHRAHGLAVYGLRLFDSGDAAAYLDGLGITYPIGDGSPFVEPYAIGTYGLPTLYVIDRHGRIARLIVGFSTETEPILTEAIERALGLLPVAAAGCRARSVQSQPEDVGMPLDRED